MSLRVRASICECVMHEVAEHATLFTVRCQLHITSLISATFLVSNNVSAFFTAGLTAVCLDAAGAAENPECMLQCVSVTVVMFPLPAWLSCHEWRCNGLLHWWL